MAEEVNGELRMIHIDEEEVNDRWIRGLKASDILKGGVGSGVKGHKTQHTKGERLSYTAEKKRWMKEKLTPEQKKQLEDIKKIEQDLAEKRESLSGDIDHDIWVDSVKKNRDIRKQVVKEVRRSKKSGKTTKVTFGMADAARMTKINSGDSVRLKKYEEVYREEHNKANPDDKIEEHIPTGSLANMQEIVFGEDWKKRFEKKEEDPVENILALHKDADITEIVGEATNTQIGKFAGILEDLNAEFED